MLNRFNNDAITLELEQGRVINKMLAFRLDYVIERVLLAEDPKGGHRERRIINELTGVRLDRKEARLAWLAILDHKWYLGEQLNRDVGLRTAATDYFENIAPPAVASRKRLDTLPPRLPMMLPLLSKS